MTNFKNIRKEIQKQNEKRLKESISDLTDAEKLNRVMRWTLNKRTSFKGTFEEQKIKTIEALKKRYSKLLQQSLSEVSVIENAEDDLRNNLIITIEWKRSYMWGSNPTASDNYGNTTRSIGGCGYDKQSTATAEILNLHLPLIKKLCVIKEKWLNTHKEEGDNRNAIEYGAGYNIIPKFAGGVGVSCHIRILEKLGYTVTQTGGKSTDVFIINKVKQ